jgi:hypothetical protein
MNIKIDKFRELVQDLKKQRIEALKALFVTCVTIISFGYKRRTGLMGRTYAQPRSMPKKKIQ